MLYSCSVTQSFAVMLIILRFSIPVDDAFYSSTATATAYVRPGLVWGRTLFFVTI